MRPLSERQKKERMAAIVEKLKEVYPDAACSLAYDGEPWKLLVMGRLSAQCTDARVNIVCRDLFSRFPTCRALADAPLSEIEEIVRPCGLYRTKAENIKASCLMLEDNFGGVLPDTMDALLSFPGVGRKIANLLLGDVHHKPAVVTDTHMIRLGGRFGMYPASLKDPRRVENILARLIAPEEQSDLCHRAVLLGREFCTARAPRCAVCPLAGICGGAGDKETRGTRVPL